MSGPDHLERRYRQWMHCYPVAWRRRHEDEMLAILVQQADEGRRRPTAVSIIDIVGHGFEARIESLIRWVPWRSHVATMSSVIGGIVAITFLVFVEIGGAVGRQPATAPDFVAVGPFLSVGVALYVAWSLSFVIMLLGWSGLARLMYLATAAFAVVIYACGGLFPRPRLMILGMLAVLAVLAAIARVRLSPSMTRRLAVGGTALAVSLVALVTGIERLSLADQWLGGYSNVNLVRVSTVLAASAAISLIIAAAVSQRWPGLFSAGLICTMPLMLFWVTATMISDGPHGPQLLYVPVYYVAVAGLLALAYRRGLAAKSN